MAPRRRAFGRAGGAARGFTLVEILVALALGVLILLALTILFSRNSGNQAELERNTRQLENARFAFDTLAEDVMHAGYYSEFNPNTLVDAPLYTLPDPCATSAATLGWNTAGAPPFQIPVAIQGVGAGTALVDCGLDRRANTEALVIRRAETGAATTIALASDPNLYIQIARCPLDAQRLRAAKKGDAVFTLRRPDCTTVNDSLRRLTQRTYYIATCNDCGAGGDGIPTLKRDEWIDGAMRTVSIAEGVENLRVEYGVDTNGDGSPDTFLAVGGFATPPVAPNLWQNVVSVRLHFLVRSTETTPGYVDSRTYQLGPAVAVTPADGFKRTLITSTVRLHNVGGRRE